MNYILKTIFFCTLFLATTNRSQFYRGPASYTIYSDLSPEITNKTLSTTFAVIGDTQRTLLTERLFLWREKNSDVMDAIVQGMVDDNPSFIVHLGDLTEQGSSTYSWELFDKLFRPVVKKSIPVLPVWGNHEYWLMHLKKSLKNMDMRFPWMGKHWYTRKLGPLKFVFLDSNQDQLSKAEWQEQMNWYNLTMEQAEKDDSVKGILVCSHHPPFTNSKVTNDEEHVQKYFLPTFFQNKKTLGYLSGHVHGYEHFKINNRDFIISAGGGGPRVKLYSGKKARHEDLFKGPSPRPFNYLLVTLTSTGIFIQVKGFHKKQQLKAFDQIYLPFLN